MLQYPIVKQKYQAFVVEGSMRETEFFDLFYKSLVFRRNRLLQMGERGAGVGASSTASALQSARTPKDFFQEFEKSADGDIERPLRGKDAAKLKSVEPSVNMLVTAQADLRWKCVAVLCRRLPRAAVLSSCSA